jgi:apolipoprotein N-acyltransferase
VVWPETALPWVIQPNSPVLPALAMAVPPAGYLLTGAMRALERVQDGVWNSLLAIDPKGTVVAHYDKVHLVPLGEYIPFHKHLGPVSGAVGRGSFEEGQSFATVNLAGLPPFSPIICYEVIFPAEVTGPGAGGAARPQWLLNVTNDAWFGLSSGPYQHLTSARLRTIEEGLPMIRSANTGVSAVIDAHGNVLASLDMMQEGIIDHVLPPARAWTPYSKWGDAMLVVLLVSLMLILVVGARGGRTTDV